MRCVLGIDTSNYTTSAALFCPDDGRMIQQKMLLPVKPGERGLRQSDAVFHHTVQLPQIMSRLFAEAGDVSVAAIGVSEKPRLVDGSYMPCFLCGTGLAESLSAVTSAAVHKTSHQIGHVFAALFSAGQLHLVNEKFIAFHVSGGTTDCLLCEPDSEHIIKITEIASSSDLKAGQAIDRCGVMLGLKFPCGAELEKLAVNSSRKFKIRPVVRDGCCSLSGIENKCAAMLANGENREDIARFCIESVLAAVGSMTEYAIGKMGELPVVYAGGVMSDKIIREKLESRYGAYFASPEFSCDNAAGTAVYAALSEGLIKI